MIIIAVLGITIAWSFESSEYSFLVHMNNVFLLSWNMAVSSISISEAGTLGAFGAEHSTCQMGLILFPPYFVVVVVLHSLVETNLSRQAVFEGI